MGIEAVKSSTPAPCRQAIRDTLKLVMTGTEEEVQTFISKFRKEFESLPPEEVAFPRSCNNIGKFSSPSRIYTKGCPMHVRGSLMYNYYVKKSKLTHKYPLIQEGEKIKFIYLKVPNRSGENVISFFQTLPKEFDLHGSIDWDQQFDKAFLSPVKVVLDAIGWTPEKRNTLEFLFA